MSKLVPAGLSIGEVAAKTGLSVSALRAWERRFGFPQPQRLARGHRRYDHDEVERIERVVAERARGRSVEAAIGSVRRLAVAGEVSLYAGLRRQRPDLPVHQLSRRAMYAVSRAIEDEASARAERALLVAAFQHEDVYRRAAPRWDELSRTAGAAVVFADFTESRRPGRGAVEVALPVGSPLRREWAVVCEGAGFGACLVGWERHGTGGPGGRGRRFEAVWSVDPEVVRLAARLGVELVHAHAPGFVAWPPQEPAPAPPGSVAQWATAVTNRVVALLDR